MKLSAKLFLAMGSMVLCTVVLGMFSLFQLASLNKITLDISKGWMLANSHAQNMDLMASDYRIQEISHIFSETDTAMANYEQEMTRFQNEMDATMEKYAALIETPEETALYTSFQSNWRKYLDESKKIVALSREMQTKEAVAILNSASLDLYTTASADLKKMVAFNLQGSSTSSDNAEKVYVSARGMVAAVLGFATLLGIILCALILRDTMKSLGKDPKELGSLARRVAQGDLDIQSNDKAGGVYADILVMVENLKANIMAAKQESERAKEESLHAQESMVKAEQASKEALSKTQAMLAAANRLEEVADIVSSASSELSAQIEQSERGAAEQAARVAETATAMEEMNSTVLEVARNASAASDVTSATRQKAVAGAQIVQQSVESIQAVEHQASQVRDSMLTLDESARAISQIMSVISDIADQTNLLALNAAIEAARAGEAGRGFAVVADEVRKLAEKTMASTHDVGNAITSIQQSAAQSKNQVEQSAKFIEQATSYANQSGEALNEIVQMVDHAADQVRGIATASEQQSASSEEINRSILQVNTIANETARAMQEAAQAVSDLAKQAHVLSGLIDQMKQG